MVCDKSKRRVTFLSLSFLVKCFDKQLTIEQFGPMRLHVANFPSVSKTI